MSRTDAQAAGTLTRRAAIAAMAAGAAWAGLSACSGKTPGQRIDEANAEIISQTDPASATLPLGSVVETDFGRWMVVGWKLVVQKGDGPYGAYDYEGLAWPHGVQFPGSESSSCALFNKGDIRAILFVGRADEEDTDMRAYMERYDYEGYRQKREVVAGDAPGVLNDRAETALEQTLRLRGSRAEELYGDAFSGGVLYADAEAKAAEAAEAAEGGE